MSQPKPLVKTRIIPIHFCEETIREDDKLDKMRARIHGQSAPDIGASLESAGGVEMRARVI